MSWGEVKKINSDLSKALNEGGVKIVKSIQRGQVSSTFPGILTINISKVNPDKTIIILSDGLDNGVPNGREAYIGASDVTETSFSIYEWQWSTIVLSCTWQVIEFY